ncbi:FAD-binding oxidoreductase [Candidatus Microgenomates bacterium]|nr:FAD-binding oxidoreductase [Candidatus Microgenomates bacterium]
MRLLKKYSHDASIFEIQPRLVVFPKDSDDLSKLVRFISSHKTKDNQLSLTARSGGTDMSGGAINDSIIVSFGKYFKRLEPVESRSITAEPGVYYRQFEKRTLLSNLLMPAYPASKNICMIGGMLANDAGGEKSLAYGKVHDYVTRLKVVLSDGAEYLFQPLTIEDLSQKLKQTDFEGEIYRQIYKLIRGHQHLLKVSKPRVNKNSTGYNLWDVWDGKTFDLTKVFVGSQGTLGLITEASFRLVPTKAASGMLIMYLEDLKSLAAIINEVLGTNPTSFEAFDEHTVRFALRFFPYFRKSLGWWGLIKLAVRLLPELRLLLKGLPKLILLVEYELDDQAQIEAKLDQLKQRLSRFDVRLEEAKNQTAQSKFWLLRRESFNILRHNVKDRHAAPFIDDLVVPPRNLPEFLPQLQRILDKYKLLYTIAGHMGDGNFHIIPLMRLEHQVERVKLEPVMREVNDLVVRYHGSLSGEHNDGLIRGPFLEQMYDAKILTMFKRVKEIFDPLDIFNPHKKITADWDFSKQHIRWRY